MKTLATLSSIAMTSAVAAQPLVGAGPNLPIPAPNNPPPASQARATAVTGANTWSGTWTAPAAPDWVGTFNAVGPIPTGLTNPVGNTRYDFTPLPTGVLPTGTLFRLGDVDGGSTQNETFTLRAFDTGGALITTPWLDLPISVSGTGTGPGGTILPGNTPGWSWTAGTGTYFFDGSTVTGGNPSLGVTMLSNTPMASLSLDRTSAFANFSLAAPLIPAPAAAPLLGFAGLAAARRRR